MNVIICRSGNVSLRGRDGHTVAVVDPSTGEVVYWDRETARSSVELYIRDYLDDRGRGLNWGRMEFNSSFGFC